jgi:hypothetical protein
MSSTKGEGIVESLTCHLTTPQLSTKESQGSVEFKPYSLSELLVPAYTYKSGGICLGSTSQAIHKHSHSQAKIYYKCIILLAVLTVGVACRVCG